MAHEAGKGSAQRPGGEKYREKYDGIDWSVKIEKPKEKEEQVEPADGGENGESDG